MRKLLALAVLGLASASASAAGIYQLTTVNFYNPFSPAGTAVVSGPVPTAGWATVDALGNVAATGIAHSFVNATSTYNYTGGVWAGVVGGTSLTHTETCTESMGTPCTGALSGLNGIWNSTQQNGGAASGTCSASTFFPGGNCDRVSISEVPGVSLTIVEQSEFAIGSLPSGFIYRFVPPPNLGFENGNLSDWQVLGDVSVQTGSLGISATEGIRYALASTLCDLRNSTGIGEDFCETIAYELPYSATNAVHTETFPDPLVIPSIYSFIGLEWTDFNGARGEGSAIRRTVSGEIGDILSIDYNYVTEESCCDHAYIVLKGLGSMAGFRAVSPLSLGATPFISGLKLCEREEEPGIPNYYCDRRVTRESGWTTKSFVLPGTGSYQIGLAVFEQTEGTVPTAILVDNLRLARAPVPPAAVDDGPIAVIDGVAKVIPVGANDTGFTDPVTVTVTTLPTKGTIAAISPPGPAVGMAITYTANIGAAGADSFVYEMSDSSPAADSATVTLNISQDADGDGVVDQNDNCTLVANALTGNVPGTSVLRYQLDSDNDGYGNACDADLNNTGLVTTADFALLRSVLNELASFSALTAAADLNGSGTVTAADFSILRARLNSAPGPSGLHP